MSNLTIKQKIILGIVVCIMLIVIGIYGYSTLHQDESIELEELISNEQVNNIVDSSQTMNNSSLESSSQDIRTK